MFISKEQKEVLSRYIFNLDELLLSNDINDLLLAIDDAMLQTLDENYNPSKEGVLLIHIYDQIYSNVELEDSCHEERRVSPQDLSMDDLAGNGSYLLPPTEEDIIAFTEHAQNRTKSKCSYPAKNSADSSLL